MSTHVAIFVWISFHLQRTSLWCVKQNQIWTFLPMHCCELLNKAAKDKSLVVDEEKYEYDLNNMTRKKRIDDKWKSEEILFVIGMVFMLNLLIRLFHLHSESLK